MAESEPVAAVRPRLDSVDLLRGLVMVIMALDHVRDHFSGAHFDPTDLARTTPALFLTRWITHFCAPVFIFLAGTAAYLSRTRGKSTAELARFLASRGLWLVFLELTVVRFAWFFDLSYPRVGLQVIWAIGMSMVVLSTLVFLPTAVIAALGVALIGGHNLFDGIEPAQFGSLGWLWCVLHVPCMPVIYPLVPWVGVMAAGYGLGPLLLRDATERRQKLLTLGLGLTAAFVVLRAVNRYGDPNPWSLQTSIAFTVLSFLDTSKYPPSLLYLLMTLGPAIALLPLLERRRGTIARGLIVYGRVPLFYYVLHLYLIHALVLLMAYAGHRDVAAFCTIAFAFPPDWGFGLPVVYLVWALVVAMLYPPSRWFADVKRRHDALWLSYL